MACERGVKVVQRKATLRGSEVWFWAAVYTDTGAVVRGSEFNEREHVEAYLYKEGW